MAWRVVLFLFAVVSLANPSCIHAGSVAGTVRYSGHASGRIAVTLSQPKLTPNQALALDGKGDVSLPLTRISDSDAFTLQFWFAGDSPESVVRQQDAAGWIIAGWNHLHALSFDGGLAGISMGRTIADGAWHQVTLTWQRNTRGGFASYIDGRLVTQRNSTDHPIPALSALFRIGSRSGTSEFTRGRVDEVALWSRAWSAEEVAARWNVVVGGDEPGLRALWHFDDASARDSGPGAFHGTMNRTARVVPAPEIPLLGFSKTLFLDQPGDFLFIGIPDGEGYAITAILNSENGSTVSKEVLITHLPGNGISVHGDIHGQDLQLTDPPHVLELSDDQSAAPGDRVILAAKLIGAPPIEMQWLKNGVPLSDDARISGSNTRRLRIRFFTPEDEGFYSLSLANAGGREISRSIFLSTWVPISDRVIGYWPFDETFGTQANDQTSYGDHGVLVNFSNNESPWTLGQIEGALSLRGPASRQFVRVPDYPKPDYQISASIWAWADALNPWGSLIKNWGSTLAGQFHLGLDEQGRFLTLYLSLADGSIPILRDTSSPFTIRQWEHVAFVMDGASARLYRNAQLVASTSYSASLNPVYLSPFAIGARLDDSGEDIAPLTPGFWSGRVDDLVLWNRALNRGEIEAIYRAGSGGRPWTVAMVETPTPPIAIRISNDATAMELTWSDLLGDFKLVGSFDLVSGLWSDENGAPTVLDGTLTQSVPLLGSHRYFRLVRLP